MLSRLLFSIGHRREQADRDNGSNGKLLDPGANTSAVSVHGATAGETGRRTPCAWNYE